MERSVLSFRARQKARELKSTRLLRLRDLPCSLSMKKLILLLVIAFSYSAVIQAADPSPSPSPKSSVASKSKPKKHKPKKPAGAIPMSRGHPAGASPKQ
jgi:hypothetical protein